MSQKFQVKPSRPLLVAGLIVAAAMGLFGIFFLIAVLKDSAETGPAVGFMALWFGVLGVIIFYYAYYLKTRKSVVDIEVETEPPAAEAGPDFEARLRKLEGLKKDGLVTEDEYRRKRAEILGEKW